MVLTIDVYYRETFVKIIGILFNWKDEDPIVRIYTI